jgi:hypothetical protein
LDIKVTDLHGNRISFGRATGRYFLKAISAILFMLGYLLAFSDKKQTMHDYFVTTLVLRRNISPSYYLLPSWPGRWQFAMPGIIRREPGAPAQRYMCACCRYRSDERWLQCPNCNSSIPLGEARVVEGLSLMGGIIFSTIGAVVLVIAVRVIPDVIHGDTPWPIEALIFGFGILFAAGGGSAFLGQNWLMRLLILVFAR